MCYLIHKEERYLGVLMDARRVGRISLHDVKLRISDVE
jgi:hypothetical protein